MVCKCSLSEFSVPSDSDILHKKKAKEELDKWNTINQFWKIKTELDKITNLGNESRYCLATAKFTFFKVVTYLVTGPRYNAWSNSSWHKTQMLVVPCQWFDFYGKLEHVGPTAG